MEFKEKLLEIQKKRLKFTKDASNPFYKSKYLTLDHMLEVLLPECDKHKILITHGMKDGCVVTIVQDTESDGAISSSFPVQENLEPQKVGSTISYAKRYNLGQLFNIITDEDDDANSTAKVSKGKKGSQETDEPPF